MKHIEVNRLEVIDHTSSNGGDVRAFMKWVKEEYTFAVTLSKQDDGKTLKIFLLDKEAYEAKKLSS